MPVRAVIINADDFGYEPEVTRGILRAMSDGIVTSTTFMVNGPYAAEAALAAKRLAVGLHLNLARWPKLSVPGEEWSEAEAANASAAAVEKEAHAQIAHFETLLKHKPTHIDVHKHLHRHAAVLDGLAQAALAHRLPVRSIDKTMRAALRKRGVATNDVFVGDAAASAYWTLDELEAQLKALPKHGVIELMCHPGYAPQLIQSGYSAQREVELETFTSPSASAALERLDVVPVSWAAAFSAA